VRQLCIQQVLSELRKAKALSSEFLAHLAACAMFGPLQFEPLDWISTWPLKFPSLSWMTKIFLVSRPCSRGRQKKRQRVKPDLFH
jgi:hypothetical protein